MDPATNGRRGVARNFWPLRPKNAEEARQGETSGHMRWVLGVSVVSVIIVFGALYTYTALFTAHQ